MNKKDCEHLGYLLSMHNPVNWDLCVAVFAMDARIEPEYELFQEAQGESDEIIELADELIAKYNGHMWWNIVGIPGATKKTYAECLDEARRTILGDDYDPSLFR
jgi:hypothetical protein